MTMLRSLLVLMSVLLIQGCRDHDDPGPRNDEELITTVQLSFVDPTAPETPLVFLWKDEDGSGPAAPVIDHIELEAHRVYQMFVIVRDDSKNPAVDITEEVLEESTEHQFFFVKTGAHMDVTYDDFDSDGRPLGLENTVTTDHESTGSLTVILRHEPNKSAAGVATGDITNAGGDTDIEASFPITITEH